MASSCPELDYLSITHPPPEDDSLASLLTQHRNTLQSLHVSGPSPARLGAEPLTLPPSGLPHLTLLSLPPSLDWSHLHLELATLLPSLTYLFLYSRFHNLPLLLPALSSPTWTTTLHTLHLISPSSASSSHNGDNAFALSTLDLLALARAGGALRQIGSRTKVHDVKREVRPSWVSKVPRGGKGKLKEKVVLEPFDGEAGGRTADVFRLGRFLS